MFIFIIEAINQLMVYGLHNLNVFTLSFNFICSLMGQGYLAGFITNYLEDNGNDRLGTTHTKFNVASHCS